MQERLEDIVGLLLAWAPLTADDVFRASASFSKPFTSIQRCREQLRRMYDDGILNRTEIPGTGRGQRPVAYYLRRAARQVVPAVEQVKRSNSLFTGLSKTPWHALAVGEFGCFLEAHAAPLSELTVLERIRDRQFEAPVQVAQKATKLVPDATVLLQVGRRRRILFLELVNETSVINPGAATTKAGSLRFQLEKYRAFNREREGHPIWRQLARSYGKIDGFQVLVVSTKDNVSYLTTAAEGARTMFMFSSLEAIRQTSNLFTDSIWLQPPSRFTGHKIVQQPLLP